MVTLIGPAHFIFLYGLLIVCIIAYPKISLYKYTSSSTITLKLKTQTVLETSFSHAGFMEYSKHQGTTQSGAFIGYNDDLLNQILIHLPAHSIGRFKAVSKHWQRLLSDRGFNIRYDRLIKSPGYFIDNVYVPFDTENPKIPPFHSLDFCHDPYGIKIIQSCNGLLLCCSDIAHARTRKYYVYNFTTKEVAIIPSITEIISECMNMRYIAMGLAFHQTHCFPYKVVCVLQGYSETSSQIRVYSSDTQKWKISVGSHLRSGAPLFTSGVYWNGAIYWHSLRRYFKVDGEQLQNMPMPVGDFDDQPELYYFGESSGHLHLVKAHVRKNRCYLNVYEMLMDHSGWSIKYQVELDKKIVDCAGSKLYVLDVVRGVKDEDTSMVLSLGKKLIRYNIYDKSYKKICLPSRKSRQAYRYIVTLTSL